MTRPAHALVGALCLLLGGCFELDTLVTVNANGSGTVTERMLLKGMLAEMIQKMGGDSSAVLDREQLEAKAGSMGPGVALASATPLPPEEGFGYQAVFTFRDVNRLRVNQSPKSPTGDGQRGEDLATHAYATFHLERGPQPVLTVHPQRVKGKVTTTRPESQAPPGPGKKAAEAPPAMLKKMLGGMRVAVAVEVNGAIVETNATHRDGARVTLLELDLDKVLEAPEGLETLGDLSGNDLAAMKEALKRFPGVKVELEPAVTIRFQPGWHEARLLSAPGRSPQPAGGIAQDPNRRGGRGREFQRDHGRAFDSNTQPARPRLARQ